ncbi:MAG: prolipoprotein diacylglyceryl transferase [Candidatus Shapirobacteria bacterium]|nr:prolipoprotein diacylglyceryl transferase [Candidatus Shapirobacteria bacterium]
MTPNLISLPYNIGSLTTFGLIIFLAFTIAAFLFFRQTKEEFTDKEEVISLLTNNLLAWLIGARLVFFLSNFQQFNSLMGFFLPWRYPGLSFVGGYWGVIIASWYWSKRHSFQIWKTTDGAVIPLLIFFGGFFLGQWLVSQEAFYLTTMVLNLLMIALAFWALKSYRSLTWYPSGKIGFSLLLSNTVFFLGFSLLAFFLSSGLYLETFLGLGLFFWSLITLYLRSESKSAKELSERITNLIKND